MKKQNAILNLPDDVVFEVLLLLPAESLPDLKRVCRQWRRIISNDKFIDARLLRSHRGVIFQTHIGRGSYRTRFAEMSHRGEIRTRDIDTGRQGRIRASCNGLLLIENMLDLYIVNPVTKRMVSLPPCDVSYKYPLQYQTFGFAFNADTREYKVVHLCEYKKKSFIGCEIITVGSGSWKEISGPFCGLTELKIPITANGVLHWALGKEHFVSMDVGSERFCKTPFPDCKLDRYHMLELGDNLSLASHVKPDRIDVWVLMDFHEGNWAKRLSVGVECIRDLHPVPLFLRAPYFRQTLDQVFLLGNLRDGEVIIFEYNWHAGGGHYAYDFKHRKASKFEHNFNLCAFDTSSCPLHVSSLITCRASTTPNERRRGKESVSNFLCKREEEHSF